jgi:hypothetical protein
MLVAISRDRRILLARQANFINLKKHKTLIDQARRSGNFAA